ncbi:sugar-binding transcriptional regulator [Rhizobium leguminosarum]|uniref:sugar-binding transcriptional regulator n=1 Tax=Rhizobium leguminosarum TaxID=384 RepID=UPI001C9669D8|nr:sugar-binding transcriptional regulator [Rhizobium leguminosarum]MBY5566220.1 sugar-binding transcriptional regulator [Rhizobium leguminosarum]MBY5573498.1 sugar-binding transcriptional regulator [Rhizobium leguminosarum]
MLDAGAPLPMEFDDAVTWAAWLYYADEMTQSEIAKTLRVSRATIVNYLQEARDRGIVSIRINTNASGRTRVARGLVGKFGLGGALVIPHAEDRDLVSRLGDAGARVLAEQIVAGDVIGVAWGRTVLSVADKISLPEAVHDLTVVQVSGSSTGEPDFSPELCTSLLSSRIGARCVNLLAPAVLSTKELRTMLLDEPVLKKQFDLIHSTNRILFGVGDVGAKSTVRASGIASQAEIDKYVEDGAVAVIIGRFIDAHGRAVGGDHDERMVGIALEELKQTPNRICVAGGSRKIEAITATLEGGYATHFVTDLATGEALLAA